MSNPKVLKERVGRAIYFLVTHQCVLCSAYDSFKFLRCCVFPLGVRSAAQKYLNAYTNDAAFKDSVDVAFNQISPLIHRL